jgi:Outer membrane protein beta-barrel family/CarboxypepD_reg-like domain
MALKYIYVIVWFFYTTLIWSQTFTISGKISDETSNPVAYANILLLKTQDSTIVSGTTSNENGDFVFNAIKANNYILKTSFISYEDNYTNIMVNEDLLIPTIILKESIEALSEVQITYKKPTLKREVDRLVFNVEKTALSEGNMMEVLRSTPGVLVLDNKITIKNSTPTVYINDKKVHLSSSEVMELLEGTSASNIQAVEVITNPPAKYGAESTVVLSIKMSKNLISGYNGTVFSNYTQGVFAKTNQGMTNYFKGEKISLFANYSYNNRKIDRVERTTINYPSQQWISDLDRNTWTETHNISLNFDWDINSNNSLNISANTQFLPYYKSTTKSTTQITPIINNEIADFNSYNLSRDKKTNLGFDLGYVHSFNKNNAKLAFNSHYTNYDYKRRQDVETDYFLGDNTFFVNNAFNTSSTQDTEIFTSKLDYNLPINDSSSFETGVKFSNVKSNSDNIQKDIIGNTEVLNTDNTDFFNYDETVYAAYLSYDKQWEKWSLSSGIRVEQTVIKAFSVSTNQNNDQDYLEWFPTANIGFQASDKVNLYANYKRSISRPDYNSLNPFKFFLNDNTVVTGNPALIPLFTSNIKLGVSINNIFTIETYYKKYKNNIFEIPIQDNNTNILTFTALNINYTEEIGLDMEAYFNIAEKWSVYIGTSFYNYKDNATLFNNTISRDRWANYTNFINNFSFLKDNSLTANFSLTYVGKNVQGLQLVESIVFTNLSFKKTIFKGKGSLSLIISDLFNQQDYFITTKFLNQDQTLYDNLDTRYIKFGFRYKFGNTKLSTKEHYSSVEERDRLGNENKH